MAFISVPAEIDHSFEDIEYSYEYNVEFQKCNNWFESTDIYLNRLTDEALDDLEIPSYFANCNLVSIRSNNPDLDIDRFLDKFESIDITTMYIGQNCTGIIINRPPKTLKKLYLYCNVNISNLPNTLTDVNISNSDDPIRVPLLPNSVINISLTGRSLGDMDLNLPSSVETIILQLENYNRHFSNWPLNLKVLYIQGYDNCDNCDNFSITMLPASLRKLVIHMQNIPFFLDLPPLLEYLDLDVVSPYAFSLEDIIPDSVEFLRVKYTFCPYMHTYAKLPSNCKVFNYIKCPADVFKVLGKKCKKIKVYLRDSIKMMGCDE